MQDPQPFFLLPTYHISLLSLPSSPLPFPVNILPCPILPQESPKCTHQWFCSGTTTGTEARRAGQRVHKVWKGQPRQGHLRDSWNYLLSYRLLFAPFLTVPSHELQWWCSAALTKQWLSEGSCTKFWELALCQTPPLKRIQSCFHNTWKLSPLGSWLD